MGQVSGKDKIRELTVNTKNGTVTLGITTLSIMKFSIMTLSEM